MTQPRTARNDDPARMCSASREDHATSQGDQRDHRGTNQHSTRRGTVRGGPGGPGPRGGDEHQAPGRYRTRARLLLVTAGMALLAMLDGGLLYVVFAAQDRFIFSVKHQNVASMIQALALDVAMIIFSVLALGLARKGLPANVERALIVVCALASAFMNWTASDHTSLRSVAVYVSAPILLALVTDRVISVVRRHVLGMSDDASVWARFGQRLGRAALWAARLLVDFRATRAGIHHAILAATPLPELEERAAERENLDVTAVLREELAVGLERIRRAADADVSRLREQLVHHQAQVTELLDRQGPGPGDRRNGRRP